MIIESFLFPTLFKWRDLINYINNNWIFSLLFKKKEINAYTRINVPEIERPLLPPPSST